jgi:glycosidase
MGADGFRLDAIRHLMEDGAISTHVPRTHVVLREYARHIREIAPRAFTIGEVWDSTGAMLRYYPDQLDAHFAFEVSDSIIAAVRTGSAKGLLPPVSRLQRELPAERWAPFLRNHDQTRTLTALGSDPARARVAATILLTLPGLPFIYYGEELGMTGDKPDERLRTPMHWRRARAAGFTTGAAWQALQPDSLTANVEAQERNPGSLLNLHRRLIHLRAANPALAAGELIPLNTGNDAIAAYLRREKQRVVLVVINLSSRAQRAVTLSSESAVMPSGQYMPQVLVGDPASARLRVGSNGQITGYAPFKIIPVMSAHVIELHPAGS